MKVIRFLLIIVLFSGVAKAEVKRLCMVSYQTESGSSPEQATEIQFLTGNELNRSTHSLKFESFGIYALVWFQQKEVAILKLTDSFIGVGPDFDGNAFKRLYMLREIADFEQVNSPSPRRWSIRAKEGIRFVDPRARN